MLGVYGADVGPMSMLIHVKLLEAMLGPYSSHVELMLSEERRVPFEPSPPQKERVVFGSCGDHVGLIWSLCWAYVYVDPC